ncbi:MAG: alpha-ribazole phosphatase family protein [Pseudomonadota bacterium]
MLRHTRPDVAPGICYGSSDVRLAGTFDDELSELLWRLPDIDHLVSSPLSRCRRLAEEIGTRHGIAAVIDPDLSEMDFGRWEMQPWDDIPRHEIDQWATDFFGARPHGGENVSRFLHRVETCLARHSDRSGNVLAVTHAGVIRAALALTGRSDAWQLRPAHASFWTLRFSCDLDQGVRR